MWHAFDVKLRVEVALKALRPDLIRDERARDRLRREVRAARQVVSPNVCRVFDLVVGDGHEMVSMEFVDGTTLSELVGERDPPLTPAEVDARVRTLIAPSLVSQI